MIRLCARLSGNADAAEDLAQETLLEAWRHRHKLYDLAGIASWVSAIARHVCQRWRVAQQHGASAAPSDFLHQVPASFDIEIELERQELVHLLDRALAVLPPDVRTVLVQKYVANSPHAELAAQLGLSEGAVKVKVHRGKLALQRVLTTQFRAEAAAYGFVAPQVDDWQETRMWCAYCGQRRLWGHFPKDVGVLRLRCPACCTSSDMYITNAHSATLFHGVHGYRTALRRVMAWEDTYYRPALESG
jgi:RNA polymerase sigma-70 factor (ECF subfamily)